MKTDQKRYHWKIGTGILLSTALLVTTVGCGKKAEEKIPEAATTQEEAIQVENILADHVAPGVILPDHFDTMIYPMEAVTIEHYTKGLPYYHEEEEEDSFWFSMAVLSSLLVEHEYLSPVFDEEFFYYSEDEIAMMASALYGEYAQGELEMPGLSEDKTVSPYAFYNEELGLSGLLNGDIGNLSIYITACKSYEDGFLLDTNLISDASGDVLAQFQIDIGRQQGVKESDLFHYSIYELYTMDEEESQEEEEDGEEDSGPNAENDYDEIDGVELTDDSTEAKDSSAQEDDEAPEESAYIDEKTALDLAKDYMGDGGSYTFKQMVTIGDYDYYDFAVSGQNGSVTDVLVCVNGMDVVSGIQNSDGSWSFDQ